MAIVVVILTLVAVGGYLWARHQFLVWKESLPKRRALAAAARAKSKDENKRRLSQVAHTVSPERLTARLMSWRPEPVRRKTVRIARLGLMSRRYVRIDPAQHIVAYGMTGSGKSSTLRVLGAWALRKPGWELEVWDGKWGASARPYRGKALVLDSLELIEARLRDLVERELPFRATADTRVHAVGHLAVIMDESRLLQELSGRGLDDLVTVVQTGRELGVHLWFGLQDPRADSVPSKLRDQFSCKLVHMLQTPEVAQVALKQLVAAGWAPHRLTRSGQMYVWTPKRATQPPRPVYGLWLAAGRLRDMRVPVSLTKTPSLHFNPTPHHLSTQTLLSSSPRPTTDRSNRNPSDLRARGRSVGRSQLPARQALALMALADTPLTAAQLSGELGCDRRRARETAQALVEKGLITYDGEAYGLVTQYETEES